MKKKDAKARRSRLERQYERVFQTNSLMDKNFLADGESLEQPSPLKDCPSTATPGVGMSIELQPRPNAKLESAV